MRSSDCLVGSELSLSERRVADLAAWSFKTGLMLDGWNTSEGFRRWTPSERRAFRESATPPDGSSIWVGTVAQAATPTAPSAPLMDDRHLEPVGIAPVDQLVQTLQVFSIACRCVVIRPPLHGDLSRAVDDVVDAVPALKKAEKWNVTRRGVKIWSDIIFILVVVAIAIFVIVQIQSK
jgi:hypothetical protein